MKDLAKIVWFITWRMMAIGGCVLLSKFYLTEISDAMNGNY